MKCPRCNKVHTDKPADSNKFLEENSKEISDYVDKQILESLEKTQRRSPKWYRQYL